MANKADLVDPTKAGKYPVILSDELLGKPSTETFTGVRYNHKPDTNPTLSKLKVAGPSKYDLSYNDNGMYKYQGSRSGDGGQYVLIFDPSREAFVLHKVDSLFTMNLTQTPTNNSAAKLRQEFPHLEKPAKVSSGNINIPIHEKPKETKGPATTAKGAKDSNTAPAKGKQKKEIPAAEPKPAAKAAAAAPAPAPKKTTPQSDDEEDSDDDDGGLVLEFPGGEEPSRDFSPAFPPRRFSEFVANGEEDDEDADGEEEEEDDMSEEEHFKLPSPMNPQKSQQQQQQSSSQQIHQSSQQFSQPTQAEEESEEDEEEEEQRQDDDNEEIDLEAQLEAELAASNDEMAASEVNDDSDVSEEE
ncbi:hypothetical protein PG994_007354 [Apiospora phragmitis]|uniref:Transcription elongation factor Eaf N-terminal domain-containing protein n=1 Tax=Apiospora phragmitis TaxID=2905665 RepID=A0ABR1V313_9PEZI